MEHYTRNVLMRAFKMHQVPWSQTTSLHVLHCEYLNIKEVLWMASSSSMDSTSCITLICEALPLVRLIMDFKIIEGKWFKYWQHFSAYVSKGKKSNLFPRFLQQLRDPSRMQSQTTSQRFGSTRRA